MKIEKNFGMTDEEFCQWLEKFGDDEPSGCIGCGAIAGCCDKYPNCPGNPEWKPEASHSPTTEKQ